MYTFLTIFLYYHTTVKLKYFSQSEPYRIKHENDLKLFNMIHLLHLSGFYEFGSIEQNSKKHQKNTGTVRPKQQKVRYGTKC